MTNPLLLKLELRDDLTDPERRILETMQSPVRQVRAGEEIMRQGDSPNHSTLLLEGWAQRSKTLAGGRRTISAFHIAGDFVDLHSFLLRPMDHSICALTNCKLSVVPHALLQEVTEKQPNLTRILWRDTLIDSAIHREWLAAVGRLSAVGHLAHLVCEMYLRLGVVGQTDGYSFRFPLNQSVLADATGLSTVHVNRMVQSLRTTGCVVWSQGQVTIRNWDQLTEIGEFDPTYLNLPKQPERFAARRESESLDGARQDNRWEEAYLRVARSLGLVDDMKDQVRSSRMLVQRSQEILERTAPDET